MNQCELNRAVARATGESVRTIQRLGFLIADPDEAIGDPQGEDLGPWIIDWDELAGANSLRREPRRDHC